MKKYFKNCPKCGKEQGYKRKSDLNSAIKRNVLCLSCSNKQKSQGENNPMYGKTHSKKTIQKIKEKRKEQTFNDETRKKMSESRIKHLKEYNAWNDRTHTDESRKKMRLSHIDYISKMKGQMFPKYNVDSIPIIEEYGKEHGYNFQHAENGGEYYIEELGYWVDAYDKEKNVVLEIDEPRHKYYQNDDTREKEIKDLLGCKFLRIKLDK
jgi:hypothetical protein